MRAKLWALGLLAAAAPVALWLGQVMAQAPADVAYSNQRQLRLPVNIQENRRGDFKEFLLFASWDQGRNWQQVAAIPADRDGFTFTAPNDGLYWLRVAAINRQNKQEPENLYAGPPDQKIVIDTLKPLIKIKSLDRQGDDAVLTWELQEENPDWNSFKVDYQEKGSPSLMWTPVTATAGLTGQVRFRPTTASAIIVRMQMRDLAGNQSIAQGDLSGASGVAAKPSVPLEFPGSKPDNQLLQASVKPLDLKDLSPPTPPLGLGNQSKDNNPKGLPPPPLPKDPMNWTANPPPLPTIQGDLKPIATSDPTQNMPPAIDPNKHAIAQATRKPMPPLQYVNNPEVTVDYELTRVGPSGVASVELWWTQDEGRSWDLYAYDEKVSGIKNGKHQRTVELPGDGVYGFTLVVKSGAGRGKTAPRPGEIPEMRVEVDTVPPSASLYPPTPDTSRPHAMLFRWQAKDTNLGHTPVTLEWSPQREGPWKAIAVNLPNSGKYSWQLPDNVPVEAYIRLRVRDQAGNETVASSQDPQPLDLSEPEGRLLNVTVSPRR